MPYFLPSPGPTVAFGTVALAQASRPATAPAYITTAFFNSNQVAGSGALYSPNGTSSGDVVITLADGSTQVGYDIDVTTVRASMLYDLTVSNAMTWLEPLLERGFPSVVIDPGTYALDGISPTILLSADLSLTFENARFTASLASGATADRMIFINTGGHDLFINGDWELDGLTIVPTGLYMLNGTTTYSKLRIDEGMRIVNCKQTLANGLGCQGAYIGGAYDNPRIIRPYIYNMNRVAGGGVPGNIGTHGLTIAYNTVDVLGTPTKFWPRLPYIDNPHIERIISEEAFASANNQDCDCLRVFTYDIATTGTQTIYSGNACTINGGVYKDFRGRAIKTQSGYTTIIGSVLASVNGAVATGLKDANFQIIGIQGCQGFNIDTVEVEMLGSGANDPFQGLWGGAVITLFSPANVSRAIYRGNVNNIVLRFAGAEPGITSGFDTLIQGAAFDGVPSLPFMLNVNNIVSNGAVQYFMEVPEDVSSNFHSININNVALGDIGIAVFVAEATEADLALIIINIQNFFSGGSTKPMTRVRGTSDPLDVTVNRSDTVFGVT